MKIVLTEMDIAWENKQENRKKVRDLVERAAAHEGELIIFPEMTLTGFVTEPALIGESLEQEDGTFSWFLALSQEYSIAIGFGYVALVEGEYFNRFTIVQKGKELGSYDKIHTFTYGGESSRYAKGNQLQSAVIGDCSFGMFICYDLRFPELFQESAKTNSAIILIANWPQERVDQWKALLQGRAIETQSYVIGVNRIGEGDGLLYQPSSFIFGPKGEELNVIEKDGLKYGYLDFRVVARQREEFPVWKDRREDLYGGFYPL